MRFLRCFQQLLLSLMLGVSAFHVYAFDTWIEQRDAGVVRQQRDYSCGLAALATLLTYDYGDPTSEQELLRSLQPLLDAAASRPGGPGVSFADLAILAGQRGYQGAGYAVAPPVLSRFRVPVVVSLQVGGRAHFSLLRGVSEAGDVWLADPSWGNRRIAAWEFRRLFVGDAADGRGRVLLVVPNGDTDSVAADVLKRPLPKRHLPKPGRTPNGLLKMPIHVLPQLH